jgi:ATP-dependent RNA helicase DDX60
MVRKNSRCNVADTLFLSVEMLFRRGYLGVVIATGTLALGINVPCKTVVFYGNSVFLTALNYRQASGRAGRRGFDRLGNVVFADIAPERVFEIMSSRLPDLKGQFSISTTLILRLLTLLHGTNNTDIAVAATNSLLAQTRTYLGGYEAKAAVLHHVRFSIEYLRRQHLVSEDGTPLNFCGLVSHLYYAENSAFAFHALLKSGYFHKLCANIRTDQQGDILQELVLTMAHLFGRQPIHRSTMDYLLKNEIIRHSPSVVFLPQFPNKARQILAEHDGETLNMFKGYVRTYISQYLQDEPDLHLPFSGTRVAPRSGKLSEAGHSTLPTRLLLTAPQIRSPFAALSGHLDDTIDSIHDLCATVRAGVFLEELAIPHVPVPSGDAIATHKGYRDVEDHKLNAYLYDFFKHGDATALKRDNLIRSADLWHLLKGFSLVLATIVTSLGCFIRAGGALGYTDEEKMFQVMYRLEEDDQRNDGEALKVSLSPSISRMEASTSSALEKNKASLMEKKKATRRVLNSWEDSEESGDDLGPANDETVGDWDCELSSNGLSADASADGESLTKVLLAFTLLREEFDTKLRKIGA